MSIPVRHAGRIFVANFAPNGPRAPSFLKFIYRQVDLEINDFHRDFYGERAGVRTLDLLIKSQLLYQLSYALPIVPG